MARPEDFLEDANHNKLCKLNLLFKIFEIELIFDTINGVFFEHSPRTLPIIIKFSEEVTSNNTKF